jgi:uncharacterized membrane protein YgcG
MKETYWDSPVTPIVIFVVALGGVIAIVTTTAAHVKRKKIEAEKERKRMERRVADRLAAEREARLKRAVPFVAPGPRPRQAKPTRTVPMQRSARTNTYRPQPRQSEPADDTMNNMLMAGLLFDSFNHASENRNDSPSPSYDSGSSSTSSSYDGGSSSSSYDSGSSSSSDSGGSFGGGDSGSF